MKDSLSVREWVAIIVGMVVSFGGMVLGAVLYRFDLLPVWAGWTLAVVAIAGLVLLVGTTVWALLRGDTEGVERQDAARASMVTVLVIVIAGFAYALLEAFAGLPRVTAAVPAAVAFAVWVFTYTWGQRDGEEE